MLIPSRYNCEIICDGKRYLYNLLTVALVELTDIGSLEEICNTNTPLVGQLADMGFLVEDGFDEFDKYRYFFETKRFAEASRKFKLVLIPTYGCNLRCPYCYQGQEKNPIRMGESGADRVLNFMESEIAKLCASNSVDSIDVNFFGGEPLLDKDGVVRFCDGAAMLAERMHLPIRFDMTTNFTLLDKRIEDLIRRREMFVQVTIDGPQELHDKRRMSANGEGSYSKIIGNLRQMHEDGLTKYVHLRINVDNETVQYADRILSDLDGLYGSVYFSVVVHHLGANDCHKELCVKEERYSEYVTKTNSVLAACGLPVHRPFGKRAPCSLVCPNQYFVDCNFDVYGCDCLINHPECKIGRIDLNGHLSLNDEYFRQMGVTVTNTEKCRQCKWAPACGGGCPATKYINSKGTNGRLECQCIVDEDSLGEYLKDYIRRNAR